MPERSPYDDEEDPEPLLYSAEAAAKVLGGISVGLLQRLVTQGKLHPIKLGRRTMFSIEDLQRFVREETSSEGE